ncbi:hypothetical protein ACFL6Y_07445 [Elusimicrobiota bacterium]
MEYMIILRFILDNIVATNKTRITLTIHFLGAATFTPPYPEWLINKTDFENVGIVPVYYRIQATSNFSKHWDLTSPQIDLEAKWARLLISHIRNNFDDELFLSNLYEKIVIRSAVNTLGRQKIIKSTRDPVLDAGLAYQ